MKKFIPFLLILVTLALVPVNNHARADGLVEVVDQSVDYSFGEEITFQIEYESDKPIESITLSIHAPGLPTFVGAVSIPAEGEGNFVYAVSDRPLPALSFLTNPIADGINTITIISLSSKVMRSWNR